VLVLSRRNGESIVVGDDIVITVLEIRGDHVRLGVSAPRNVQVHREEVYRDLAAANQAAASPDEDAIDALSRAVRDDGSD
jgi:carbon storage regulator